MGCRLDILTLMDSVCSGRHSCDISVTTILDSLDDDSLPCLSQLRGYMEASYSCVRVVVGPTASCTSPEQHVGLTTSGATSGYLANIVTEATSHGSLVCPWVLQAPSGQSIKITLHDFSVASRDLSDYIDGIPRICHVLAVIKEDSIKSSETICASDSRTKWVYTSVSNEMEIRIVSKNKNSYFLLEYEVSGCPDLPAPPFGWVERVDNSAILGCNRTKQSWQLTCKAGQWIGKSYNCTPDAASSSDNANRTLLGIFTGSQWAAIVIILAIAITLGLVIFLVGLMYLRRKRHQRQHAEATLAAEGLQVPDYYSATFRENPHQGYPKTMSTGSDGYSGSTENDYYRTWQLQRHPAGGRPPCSLPQTSAHGHITDHHEVVEHIYESPKFDRKEMGLIQMNETGNNNSDPLAPRGHTQYFELDPEEVHMHH
ncbi:hypothetical protein CAPTEDRAFT_204696 [Capitella teleta]|uniref:CUB domain-containing protein n=1 Tax=Capitella teleta TaxID=283909 RepID=R7V710_CAPTE|nr:hypothetical protein CAPTEDRAFT_204696 [Capitella teleta]|eukprot:ELU12151.1 hypothetical protein CAPTEDRAFT_204696 [Capitella teleta]